MENYPYLSESIANVLEIIRKERGMSKTALADFAGTRRSYILEIVKGQKKPTVNIIFHLCKALHISPVDFFRRVEEEMEKRKK